MAMLFINSSTFAEQIRKWSFKAIKSLKRRKRIRVKKMMIKKSEQWLKFRRIP